MAKDPLTMSETDISLNNLYPIVLCSLGGTKFEQQDIQKIKTHNWNMVSGGLDLREQEVVWRFKHNAVLTPVIAQQLCLANSSDCPFCHHIEIGKCTHYLDCTFFEPMWNLIGKICSEAGATLTARNKMHGFVNVKEKVLNHLIYIGYAIIYEKVNLALNNVPVNVTVIARFKQKLFEYLYISFFKARMSGLDKIVDFELYWNTLKCLFKISGKSIEITLPA